MANPAKNSTTTFSQTLTVIATDDNQRIMQIPADNMRIGLVVKNGGGACQMRIGAEATATDGYPIAINEILPSFNHPDSCPKGFISFYALATTTLSFVITSQLEG